jgi:chromosome partitioning protein
MVDARTNYAKDIITLLRANYSEKLKIYKNVIPLSVRVSEISVVGKSIYVFDPKGKVSQAYGSLTKEVLVA